MPADTLAHPISAGPPPRPTARRRRVVPVPFINTLPTTDVGLLLMLLPVWWVMGIEQLVWPIGLSFIGAKVLLMRRFKVKAIRTLRWLVLFICVHLISGLFIVESVRWLTFFRNLSAYICALMLVLIITNAVDEWRQVKFLMNALMVMMAMAAVLGVLGLFGIWRPEFQSLIGRVVPGWIANSMYGRAMVQRATGAPSWFLGLTYFRLRTFFMFATMYASALALFIPVVLYARTQAKHWRRAALFTVLAVLLLTNLAGTTGRVASMAFIAGAAYYLWYHARLRKQVRLAGIFVLAGSLIVAAANSGGFADTELETKYGAVVLARGGGSYNHRSYVYEQTLLGITDRPFFGWGTERDLPGSPYPAGSHSYYLGITYKQGLIGLAVFIAMWCSLWRDTRPVRRKLAVSTQGREIEAFLRFGRWTLVAVLLNGMTDVLDLDSTTMVIMWSIFGSLIAARQLWLREEVVSVG